MVSHCDPAEVVIDGAEPPTMLTGLDAVPPGGDLERMMYLDLTSYLPDDILVKVDRAAMATSLETRMPFLDHRLVEFALSLPLSISRAEGTPKWPLRQLLYKRVPRALVDRPKMGFGIPVNAWLRGALRDWAENLLDRKRLEAGGLLRPQPVREAWEDHLSGRRDCQYFLWNVLMFEAWRDAERQHQRALAA
jgi:asparagine synthase (glutamine-hydrolysing)